MLSYLVATRLVTRHLLQFKRMRYARGLFTVRRLYRKLFSTIVLTNRSSQIFFFPKVLMYKENSSISSQKEPKKI